MKTLTMSCPDCGGKLDVSDDMTRFTCGYCGTEQLVERRGGTVSLKVLTHAIAGVQAGTDKTAAELALKRLRGESEAAQQEWVEADAEFREHKKSVFFIVLFGLGAIVVGLWFFTFKNGAVLGILALLVSVGTFFLASRSYKQIDTKRTKVERADEKKRTIQENIAKNRKFVDS